MALYSSSSSGQRHGAALLSVCAFTPISDGFLRPNVTGRLHKLPRLLAGASGVIRLGVSLALSCFLRFRRGGRFGGGGRGGLVGRRSKPRMSPSACWVAHVQGAAGRWRPGPLSGSARMLGGSRGAACRRGSARLARPACTCTRSRQVNARAGSVSLHVRCAVGAVQQAVRPAKAATAG